MSSLCWSPTITGRLAQEAGAKGFCNHYWFFREGGRVALYRCLGNCSEMSVDSLIGDYSEITSTSPRRPTGGQEAYRPG